MQLLTLVLFASLVHATEPPADRDAETAKVLKQVEAISQDIDSYLLGLAPYRNAMVWSQGFIEIIKHYPFVDFYLLEGRLRKLNLDAYLVAAPIEFAPPEMCSRALLGIPEGNLDYYLWVGVNGRDEMLRQLKIFNIPDEAANLEHLKKTGMLTRKPN